MSDLSQAQIAPLLSTRTLGRSLELKPSTASTNDDARRAASDGCADGHVIVADTQTAGRGSRGRAWSSPAGTDLYFSVVARLALPAASVPPLTLVVGLAVAEALDAVLATASLTNTTCVKWPNDVWLAGHKLVGILVESASVGERLEPLVIGIGINVNRESFPDDLAVPATSLALAHGSPLVRSRVLARVLNQLESWLDRFVAEGPGAAIDAINQRLALRNERARCGDVVGIVQRVASSGALVLQTERGPVECFSGTVRRCAATGEAPA